MLHGRLGKRQDRTLRMPLERPLWNITMSLGTCIKVANMKKKSKVVKVPATISLGLGECRETGSLSTSYSHSTNSRQPGQLISNGSTMTSFSI
eukprot:408371-Pelagomonas_calceolata.AAC.1